MVADNLLLVGTVGLVTSMLMVMLYFAMLVEPITLDDFFEEEDADHQPALDDDMVYFTYSMYPYHEFMYFNAAPRASQAPSAQPAR
ncbi:MAG: hypothetical protein U0350_48905 [Caldilineaceae bacterium]